MPKNVEVSLGKKIILTVIVLGMFVYFVNLVNAMNSSDYVFDEPENIYSLIHQHLHTSYACPEEKTNSAIEAQINKQSPALASKLTSEDISKFMVQCDKSKRYFVGGIAPEPEIAGCFNKLDKLARDNDMYERDGLIYSANVRWVYRECYIRQYFEQRFNKNTIEDYDQLEIDKIYEQRDSQLLQFLDYKIKYPSGTGPGEIVDDNGIVIEQEKEIVQPSEEEIKNNPEKYDSNPSITLVDEIPSKSIIQTIREKLGTFFDWFK